MKLDLSTFKKIDQNATHTKLQHPDGHEIHICHENIDKGELEGLRRLPMSKGGTIPTPKPNGELLGTSERVKKGPISKPTADKFAKAAGFYADGGKVELSPADKAASFLVNHPDYDADASTLGSLESTGQVVLPEAGSTASLETPPADAGIAGLLGGRPNIDLTSNEPAVAPSNLQPEEQIAVPQPTSTQPIVNRAEQAIQNNVKTQEQVGQATAAALDKSTQDIAAIDQHYQQEHARVGAEADQVAKEIADGKIDPNHYLANMSTGSRIATGIGMLLSGLGGNSGADNSVIQFINKQIDRDIEAQKANLGKKESLLSAYHKQMGDTKQAAEAAKLTMIKATQNEIAKQVALGKGAQAAAASALPLAKLQEEATKLQDSIARGSTANKIMQSLKQPGNTEQKLAALEQVDPGAAKEARGRITPVGLAHTTKDAEEVNTILADTNTAKTSIKRLLSISKQPLNSLNPKARTEAQSLVTLLVGALNRPITGGGPMSSTERELVTSLAANPTKIFSLGVQNKAALETLEKFADRKLGDVLKSKGLSGGTQQQSSPNSLGFRPTK